jgi:hypothetical protein
VIIESKILASLLLVSESLLCDYYSEPTLGKMDYSTVYSTSQLDNLPNTMEYNYITTEQFIKDNNKKYQEDLLH